MQLQNKVHVSLPYRFTLFSNIIERTYKLEQFHYLIDLHYSQTTHFSPKSALQFHYLIDLHYSQTYSKLVIICIEFHYLIDLHYSQTIDLIFSKFVSFTTLQIYTILKLISCWDVLKTVSLPYRFTLFSNCWQKQFLTADVSLPYRFTLFSNSCNT